jgi:hypothetical protein
MVIDTCLTNPRPKPILRESKLRRILDSGNQAFMCQRDVEQKSQFLVAGFGKPLVALD